MNEIKPENSILFKRFCKDIAEAYNKLAEKESRQQCDLADNPKWREGKCWGLVDVIDSIDGSGVFCCKGHAEMYREVQNDNNEWIEGKYIPEHP